LISDDEREINDELESILWDNSAKFEKERRFLVVTIHFCALAAVFLVVLLTIAWRMYGPLIVRFYGDDIPLLPRPSRSLTRIDKGNSSPADRERARGSSQEDKTGEEEREQASQSRQRPRNGQM